MKTRHNPFIRAALSLTSACNVRWFGSIAGFSLLGLSGASAQWNGSVSTDWNTAENWTPAGVPAGINAIINTASGNIATISADVAAVPVDIIVGNGIGTTGRVDHLAGTIATGAGNWLYAGANGGTGTYNLANPSIGGGQYTGMGQSSGSINVGGSLYIGGNAANTNGTFNMNTSGTVAVPGALQVGQQAGAIGVLNIDSGTMTTGGWSEIGNFGGNGTLRMSGGALTKGGADHFIIAANGATGFGIISGGALTVNNEIWVGNGANSVADLQFSGGTITNSSWVAIGRDNGTGNVDMSGGTWTKDGGGNFIIGASGPGTMTQTGGLVDVQTGITWIGEQNNATASYTLSGTGEFRTSQMVVARDGGTTATVNLDGGTLRIGRLNGGGGAESVYFNGTQIIATAPNAAFISDLGTSEIKAGNLLIDSNGHNIASNQSFMGAGGVVKSGAGTLTLNGFRDYTGPTIVNAGKLDVTTFAEGNGAYTVADGAALGVRQDFTGETLTIPSLTLGSDSTLEIDLGNFETNTTVAPLTVTSLTANGPVTLNVRDQAPAVGAIPLVAYTGPKLGTGAITLGTLPNGVVGTLNDNGSGLITLNVTSASLPRWEGNVSNVWDTATLNWINRVNNAATTYADPAPVLFDDNATGPTDIVLNATVNPSSVTFDNSALPYSLSGTGKISGTTGLLKQGSGTAAITGLANDYTGVTRIEGGVLEIDSLTNGGVAGPIGAATSATANLALAGGTLSYTGAATTSDRGFAIVGNNSGIRTANNLTLSGPFAAVAGNWVKTGAGTLELTNSGENILGAGGSFRVEEGAMVISGSGTWINNAPTLPGENFGATSSLTLTGSVQFRANDRFQTALAGDTRVTVTVEQNAGLVKTGGWLSIGNSNNGVGILNVRDNGTVVSNNDFNIGDVGDATGTINLSDNGSITSSGLVFIGKGPGNTGIVNQTGGTFLTPNDLRVGSDGKGTWNQSAGTTTCENWLVIARFAPSEGIVNVSGGTFNQTRADRAIIVGEVGRGTLNISENGSVVSLGNAVWIGNAVEAVGVVNLDGGSLTARHITEGAGGAGSGTFNFNGGLLRVAANPNAGAFMTGIDTVTVKPGGARIDTNGQSVTIPQALADGGGGLVKSGAGTLTLTGANTYSGGTTVTAGTLALGSAFLADTATVTIASGAQLQLDHGDTDDVAGLVINGSPLPAGTYDALSHPGIISGSGKLRVTGTAADPYSDWASAKGLTAANNGPEMDPDQDGISNLLEFILGGNPLANDRGILPQATVTATDFVFTFNRSDASEKISTLNFQWSTNFGTWNDVLIGATSSAANANGVSVAVSEGDPASADDAVTVTVPRANAPDGRLFGRLRATQP